MTNHQGYAVFWDESDTLGRSSKQHRYFNTIGGAHEYARGLNEVMPNCNAKVNERGLLSDDQMKAAERALIQKLNRDELTRLMLQYGFTIRTKDFPNWRPTKRVKGTVPGVWETVEIIATDGLLGIYLNNATEPITGHVQMFSEWPVETLFTAEKDKAAPTTKKKKTLSKRQLILLSM